MSAYGTSSPSIEHTRLYWTRPPSSRWTCRKLTLWLSVAEYRCTGMDTSPKATVPFHIDRIAIAAPPNPSPRPDRGHSPMIDGTLRRRSPAVPTLLSAGAQPGARERAGGGDGFCLGPGPGPAAVEPG